MSDSDFPKWSEMTERERDALVAEKVMGYTVRLLPAPRHEHEHGPNVPVEPQSCDLPFGCEGPWAAMYWVIPHFTTEIGPAWEVVEKMRSDGYTVHVISDERVVSLMFKEGYKKDGNATANTAPEAICLAALRAKGVAV